MMDSKKISNKEEKILAAFGKVVPKLTEIDKERLLCFGEGMAFKYNRKIEGISERNDQPAHEGS